MNEDEIKERIKEIEFSLDNHPLYECERWELREELSELREVVYE